MPPAGRFFICLWTYACYNFRMKKFDRNVRRAMGSLPSQLLKYVDAGDIKNATAQFNNIMTQIARDFHAQLADGVRPDKIVLTAPRIFGHDVNLEYAGGGSVGSVYKMQIGRDTFAFKINRRYAYDELNVMPIQSRARNLVNKMYMGDIFEYNGRKYSWVLSDYVANDKQGDFAKAMEKLYYLYLTKGVGVLDAHPNNFIGGKLIDQASFAMRDGKLDDIKKLSRVETDIVKKLAYYIRTDNLPEFKKLIVRAVKKNPAVIEYMFLAMKFGKSPIFIGPDKSDAFSLKIKKFESVVDMARRGSAVHGGLFAVPRSR